MSTTSSPKITQSCIQETYDSKQSRGGNGLVVYKVAPRYCTTFQVNKETWKVCYSDKNQCQSEITNNQFFQWTLNTSQNELP